MFSMPRFLTRLIVVSNMVWKTINALVKEILLTLQLPYLNGPVEATNNHIKVLKKRIMALETSFTSKSEFLSIVVNTLKKKET